MRTMKVRLSALVVAFCAVLSLALFGVVAQAAEDFSFALTVHATASKDEEFVTQVKKADLVLDIYRVASAEKKGDTYSYTWDVDAFKYLEPQFKTLSGGTGKASDWQELYDAATKIVEAGKIAPDQKVNFSDGIANATLDTEGIYLLIARGADQAYGSCTAKPKDYTLTFLPTMVAAPTKWAEDSGDMSGTIRTDSSYGEWKDEATLYLKSAFEKDENPPHKRKVKTGDEHDAQLLPLYIAMGVSGVAFAGLAGYGAWQRRREG